MVIHFGSVLKLRICEIIRMPATTVGKLQLAVHRTCLHQSQTTPPVEYKKAPRRSKVTRKWLPVSRPSIC